MRFLLLFIFAMVHGCGCVGVFANTLKAKGQSESDSAYSDVFRLEAPNKSLTKIGDKKVLLETGDKNLLTNSSFEHETVSTGWTVGSGVVCEVETATANILAGEGKQSLKCTATAATGHLLYQDVLPSGSVQGRNLGHIGNVKTAVAGLQVCGRHAGASVLCGAVDTVDTFKEITLNSTGPASGTIGVSVYAASSFTGVFYVDAFKVGERAIAMGTIQTEWESWTPTLNFASGGASNYTVTGKKRRNGPNLEIYVVISFTGTSSSYGGMGITIPSGLSIPSYVEVGSIVGETRWTGTATSKGSISKGSDTSLTLLNEVITSHTGTVPLTINSTTETLPVPSISGQKIIVSAEFPIQGWTAGARVSDGYDGQVITAMVEGASNQSIANGTFVKLTTALPSSATQDSLNGSSWDGTNKVFKILSAGYYKFGHSLRWPVNGNGSRVSALQVGGAGQSYLNMYQPSPVDSTFATMATSPALYLNVGQTVGLVAYQTSGGALDVNGAIFTMEKLSGAAYISPMAGEVKSTSGNLRVLTGRVTSLCTSSPCTVANSVGGVASVTRAGTGSYSINVTPAFGGQFQCFIRCSQTGTSGNCVAGGDYSSSTTGFGFLTYRGDNNTAVDSTFQFMCIGPQ